jgi:hypothetical protein
MTTADPSPAKRARDLVRAGAFASLSTLDANDGWPYGSLVMTACGHDGAPFILISRLAVHTKNIDADNKVALLFDHTGGFESRLAGPRASVTGRAERTDDTIARARFCARHPDAAELLRLDFAIYRVAVERGHLVGGFGDVHDIDGPDLIFDTAGCDELIANEAGIVAHMNDDHADAVDLYANVLLERPGGGWRLSGCDPEGCDLLRAGETARLAFPAPVRTPADARTTLVGLVAEARRRTAG